MNSPQKSPDPLLQILAEETVDLPVLAASAARQRNAQRRQNRQRLALAATASLGILAFALFPSQETQPTVGAQPVAPKRTDPLDPSAHDTLKSPEIAEVKPVQNSTLGPEPLPSGLDLEQMAFVSAARDMPLLLVRDRSGKVTRIHIVQR